MKTEKRRAFVIHFAYFSILFFLAFAVLKYGLSMLSPFVAAFLIAWILKGPIGFVSKVLHLNWKIAAILVVLLFYSTIGFFISILGVKAFSAAKEFADSLPEIYTYYVEPALISLFDRFGQSVFRVDAALLSAFMELESQIVQSAGQMVSSLSMNAVGHISGMASSLPGLFIEMLLMIISTFFIASDYHRLTGFCLMQLDGKWKGIFLQVKEYVVGTLLVCIRSYALIMTITFVELAVGLSVIGVKNPVLIALLISVFDILPVLGTGGIMIPWTLLTAFQGNYTLALGLLLVYLFVTVVRNIVEPKIVGSQIGVHPVVTLAGMFVGAQLFGLIGLFGFPIGISLLRHLNESGAIKVFKMAEEG